MMPDGFCEICGQPHCTKHKGRYGWLLVAVVVVVWDLTAPETLSSAFLRRRTHPAVILAWAGLTAHLFGVLPRQYDPLCRLTRWRT